MAAGRNRGYRMGRSPEIEAVRGVWDGVRVRCEQEEQVTLGKVARHYILQHEFMPRGSAWRRFRREIALALRRSRLK